MNKIPDASTFSQNQGGRVTWAVFRRKFLTRSCFKPSENNCWTIAFSPTDSPHFKASANKHPFIISDTSFLWISIRLI